MIERSVLKVAVDIQKATGIYRLSRYAHEFTNDGLVCLYHSLGIQTIYLGQKLWQKLKSNLDQPIEIWVDELETKGKKAVESLLDAHLLIPVEYDEGIMLQHVKDNCGWGKSEIGVLYLMVTEKCNFNCRYCFIEAGIPNDYHFEMMKPETADASIELLARLNQTDKTKIIIFYGGEPLLNWPTIKSALKKIGELEKCGQLKGKNQRVINTNGSLITEKIAEDLAEHQVTVAVSLDGPAEIHDLARIYPKSKKSTYSPSIRGYWLAKKAGARTVVSMTIAEHNLAKLESDVFPWIFDLEPDGIGYNLLLGSNRHDIMGVEYAREATSSLIKLHELAREHGLGVERMIRKLRFFAHRWIYPNDCAGCGKQIVVAPNGQLGPCHAYIGSKENFVFEDYTSFNPANHPLWLEWSRRSPLDFSGCEDCSVLGICGGGCVYNAVQLTGSIRGIDPAFCEHAKTILKWMVWDLYRITKQNQSPFPKEEMYDTPTV